MSAQVTKKIEIPIKWVSGASGVELTQGEVNAKYTITASINDDFNKLNLKIHCDSLTTSPSATNGGELNCVFISALLDTPHGYPNSSGFMEIVSNASDPDMTEIGGIARPNYNWDSICSEIAKSSFNQSWNDVKDNMVCAVGMPDSQTTPPKIIGIAAGQEKTISKTISSNDFDDNGNYKANFLLISSNRFWNTRRATGELAHQGKDINGRELAYGDRIIQTKGYKLRFSDFSYFPGAIKKGNEWKSCNRYYSSDNQGHASIRKSGTWRNVINNINPSANSNNGFIRKNSKWYNLDLIGVDSNTREEL